MFFVGEWAIRLVMLVWVPQKRSPAAARTWLLLIFIEPVIGLVLYGVFGRPYMPRRRVEMLRQTSRLIRTRGHEVLAPYITRPDLPTAFQHAIELAENLGDFPILSGNRVELLPDYEGALTRLVADIDAAAGRQVAVDLAVAVAQVDVDRLAPEPAQLLGLRVR